MKPRNARGRKKKRRATAGSFKPGPDPRRHVFTRQDCWLGYAVAYIRHPELRDWLKLKIRCYYHYRERKVPDEPKEAVGCGAGGDESDIPF